MTRRVIIVLLLLVTASTPEKKRLATGAEAEARKLSRTRWDARASFINIVLARLETRTFAKRASRVPIGHGARRGDCAAPGSGDAVRHSDDVHGGRGGEHTTAFRDVLIVKGPIQRS